MTIRSVERLPMAIALGLFVGLTHLGAFTATCFTIGKDLWLSVQRPMEPDVRFAQLFRGELVIPHFMSGRGNLMDLRFVDLKTGTVRATGFPGVEARGLVTDGKTLWAIGIDDQIYETDGTTAETYRTKQKIAANMPGWDPAFLYEGCPAIIAHDDTNIARLLVLVDRDWEDRGQIALPRVDRVWTVDDQTGQPTMVASPRVTYRGNASGWRLIYVQPVNGKYHLFRTEPIPGKSVNQQICRISHHVGFEFVSAPVEGEPASAVAPVNSPAAASDWELIDHQIGAGFVNTTAQQDRLLFGSRDAVASGKMNVWRQVDSNEPLIHAKFESLMTVNRLTELGFVSSPETNETYLLTQPRFGEMDVYQLDGDHLEKMPYQIDGMATPIVRKFGMFLRRIIAIFWVGTLLFILGAAWLTRHTGQSTFSFGQETVPLAPLVRRSVARLIDLALILSPLLARAIWAASQTDSETWIVVLLHNISGGRPIDLTPFVPGLLWAAVVWLSLIVSTALWGVSPGKWLCGIRVIRATSRPCGFTRALLRELMLWVDAPLLLTGIPAVVSWLATDFRQRIGDYAADTIVIVRWQSCPQIDSPSGDSSKPQQI
jgi:uncharacterized RDD family membrane protein YckC